ncbi:DUF2252 domain-containing protein [uncultured Paludibaculum sp.]|uniref:DUF2252 domain-containing protein n=1 Tax=uncultured Paludibaculum sp. TaxID=1765020 RepID=UPI002AAAFFDB|nr:DUF2252 domain-containing protein [uncultured Paludibaculum sp.]
MPKSTTGGWQDRRAEGKSFRDAVPREALGDWKPAADRPDPVQLILTTNQGRQERYVPLRMGRMAESPFGFLRGAAAVMTADLAASVTSGIHGGICGDAHFANFGLFGTAQRDVTLDLNDFDEARLGPWEWDLKRLCISINVYARQAGLPRKQRASVVERCSRGYRQQAITLQDKGALHIWYLNLFPGEGEPLDRLDPKYVSLLRRALDKARTQNSDTALDKLAERDAKGAWRLKPAPPVLSRVDGKTRHAVEAALADYVESLPRERRSLMRHYRVADIGHRVGGVGSAGVRNYVILMFGACANDGLVLQVKEATAPVPVEGLPGLPPDLAAHHGRRVVFYQRLMQASGDILLGWTSIDGRAYYVRQQRNLKGQIPVERFDSGNWQRYAYTLGGLLARAHARSGDIALIAGYCGSSQVLDEAMARWAEAYGDQTVMDHAQLVEAIQHKKVRALAG